MSAGAKPAAASACCIASRAPTPSGMRRGHVIGVAALADAEQQRRVAAGARGSARSSSAKAAASPIEMPSRAASNGRQGPATISCSE